MKNHNRWSNKRLSVQDRCVVSVPSEPKSKLHLSGVLTRKLCQSYFYFYFRIDVFISGVILFFFFFSLRLPFSVNSQKSFFTSTRQFGMILNEPKLENLFSLSSSFSFHLWPFIRIKSDFGICYQSPYLRDPQISSFLFILPLSAVLWYQPLKQKSIPWIFFISRMLLTTRSRDWNIFEVESIRERRWRIYGRQIIFQTILSIEKPSILPISAGGYLARSGLSDMVWGPD